MAEYEFTHQVSSLFQKNVESACGKGIVAVDAVRTIADQTVSEFIEELRRNKRALDVLAEYPHILEHRVPRNDYGKNLADRIFDVLEVDVLRGLDVREAWASQFPADFSPLDELADAAERMISEFEGVLSSADEGSDHAEHESIVVSSREALSAFRATRSDGNYNILDHYMGVVCSGLRSLKRHDATERWYASWEASARLERDDDGKWFMAH